MVARGLPFVLSVIAGATDIIGVLGLNGLFTAHITGNLVLLAARIVADLPARGLYILSVPVFMLVLLISGVIARRIERNGRSSLQPLLLLQLLALVAFFSLSITAGPWRDPDTVLAIIAGMCGVAAMAVQNTLTQIGLKNLPATAVMTTNVTRLMLDFGTVLAGGDVAKAKSRALDTLPVVIGFVIGCAPLGEHDPDRAPLSSVDTHQRIHIRGYKNMAETRIETDSLGKVEVPADKL